MSSPAAPKVGAAPFILEPTRPGTSMKYLGGPPFHRYLIAYFVGSISIFILWSAVGILLPNQIQLVEFDHYFAGTGVTPEILTQLASNSYTGPDAAHLTEIYNQYNAARASSLSVVNAVGSLFTLFSQPLVGVFSDRWRSRWGRRSFWIFTGALIGALLLIGLRYAPSVLFITVFWVTAQVSINFSQGPLTTTIADRTPEDRLGTVSAIAGVGTMAGALMGSFVAGYAFNAFGLDTYYFFAVFLVFGTTFFVLMAKDRSSRDLELPSFSWKEFLLGFTIALRDHDYRWVWVARLLMFLGYTASTTFNLYVLQSYIRPTLTQAQANATLPLLSLVSLPGMIIAMLVSGKASDMIGRRKPFVIFSSFGIVLAYTLPIFWPTLPALFAMSIITGFAFGVYMTVDQALFIDVLPDPESAGRDLGLSGAASNIGQMLAPVIAGQIVALIVGSQGYRMVYVFAAVAVLLAALAIYPVKKVK